MLPPQACVERIKSDTSGEAHCTGQVGAGAGRERRQQWGAAAWAPAGRAPGQAGWALYAIGVSEQGSRQIASIVSGKRREACAC